MSNNIEGEFTQKGPEGRIVEGVPEDVNVGIKYFNNRLCPFAHRYEIRQLLLTYFIILKDSN
jgi:hypothetical protein